MIEFRQRMLEWANANGWKDVQFDCHGNAFGFEPFTNSVMAVPLPMEARVYARRKTFGFGRRQLWPEVQVIDFPWDNASPVVSRTEMQGILDGVVSSVNGLMECINRGELERQPVYDWADMRTIDNPLADPAIVAMRQQAVDAAARLGGQYVMNAETGKIEQFHPPELVEYIGQFRRIEMESMARQLGVIPPDATLEMPPGGQIEYPIRREPSRQELYRHYAEQPDCQITEETWKVAPDRKSMHLDSRLINGVEVHRPENDAMLIEQAINSFVNDMECPDEPGESEEGEP